MLLAAMLAMVLAAAAPAFAQIGRDQPPVAGDDAIQVGDNIQYSAVYQNVIGAIGDVSGVQVGTATAVAVDDSAAAAAVEVEPTPGILLRLGS